MFLSDSYTSHEAFVREYKRQYNGKAKAEESYLNKFEKAVENQADLRDYYDNPSNPTRSSTDLVILASKHSKVKILKYLFENDGGNLNNSPNYNAFYYALRSGNIKVLEILIKNWPNRLNELDEIISRTYEDLKLKNVPLSEEMEVFVENKLINIRFFSESSQKDQKIDKNNEDSNIKERIELVLQSIESLKRDYSSNMEEVDDEFLFIARSIAQNINILKGLLNSTYDRLPWEEMEFCLVSFVSSYQKRQEINLFYRATLNKWKILEHLENFAKKLEDEKGQSQKPKKHDEKVVDPKFEELCSDYQQIKEVHSLVKIMDHLKKSVLSVNPNKENGQLIITKFIRVHLKGALEFSTLSKMRSSLSLLFGKMETEKNGDLNFFPILLEDLREVGNEITCILNELNGTEIFVQNTLISLGSFYASSKKDKSSQDDNDKDAQIELILQCVSSLREDYLNTEEVDEKFIFATKSIEKNLNALNRQWKSTYKKLPWDEMELCLGCFITAYTKKHEMNPFFRAALDKFRILSHIEKFVGDLGGENEIMEEQPQSVKREDVVKKIIESYPKFEGLYKDYQEIRDIRSLEKINDHIILALSANPKRKDGQLIITRVLQVIGEHLKNTVKSPKLSNTTSDFLLLSLSKNTRKIFKDLRDSLSHAEYLAKRVQIEKDADTNFFVNVQNDTKKVGDVITDILYDMKVKAIRLLLTKIFTSENSDEIKELAEVLSNVELDEKMISGNFKMMELEKLRRLVQELSDNITDKTNYEKGVFLKINRIIDYTGIRSENVSTNYITGFASLKNCIIGLSNKISHSDIDGIKFSANHILENITPKIEPNILKNITLLTRIFISKSRMLHDNQVMALIYEIARITDFDIAIIKSIEELSDQLNEKCPSIGHGMDHDHQFDLSLKLDELNSILKNKNTLVQKLPLRDKKLQALVDMQVLDVMSILESSDYLENNQLFLDDHAPLLSGKCLRNYLAHDNAVADIQLSDPSTAIILYAKNLAAEKNKIIEKQNKIGKLIKDDRIKLRKKYNKNLATITNQKKMFIALEEGNPQNLRDCLEMGADVKARSVNKWTTLHFAAKGPSLEMVKFLIDQNLSIGDRNINGQTPLHIAAAHGRTNIVDFLVDLQNNTGNQDKFGLSPLHYAIKNNHVDTAKILLGKDGTADVDGLYIAAENGNLELVNFLLQNGSDPNVKCDEEDKTALHVAAFNGHLEVVEVLILAGANGNAPLTNGCTPLHYAVESGHEKITDILLKHGNVEDVNSGDTIYHNAPLHYAARNGHEGIVRILLEHNANPNVATVEGTTPLHLAAQNGYLEIVRMVHKHAVDFKDKNNYTALHYAAENGHKEVAEFLISNGANVNAKANNNLPPLLAAVRKDHTNLTKLLIENQAEVNAQDSKGNTPLHAAAKNGNNDIVILLIDKNADFEATNSKGVTPLHIAAKNGQEKVVVFLLEKGAKINATSTFGLTPLHVAVRWNRKDIVSILLQNKAEIDMEDLQNITPLHLAVQNGHRDIVEILAVRGANVNAKYGHFTPLALAVQMNNQEIVETLLANNADVSAECGVALTTALISEYTNIMKILLKGNASGLNIKVSEGCTILQLAMKYGSLKMVKLVLQYSEDPNHMVLHFAARNRNLEVVKYVVGLKYDIHSRDDLGLKPIHIAAQEGHLETVKYFLGEGLGINERDADNWTVLHYATLRGHVDIVKYLIANGSDVNAQGRGGVTPIHNAVHQNHLDVIEVLLQNGAEYITIIIPKDSKNQPLEISRDLAVFNLLRSTERLFEAIKRNSPSEVEDCIKSGAFVNAKYAKKTPLHYAAWLGYHEVVDILLRNKASPNIILNNNLTPLHYAAKYAHLKVVKVLLSHQAVYNFLSGGGKTPSDYSADESITSLFKLVDDSFTNIKNGNVAVVGVLNTIKDIDTVKAIMGACNRENKTLIVAAMQSNFSQVEQLKQIFQGDVSSRILNQDDYQVYTSIFEKRKEILGLTNPGTLDIQICIANVLYKQGAYKKALSTYEEVFRNQEEILGLNDQNTLSTRSKIALVLSRQGKYEEAFNICQEAYQKQTEILGPNHSDTLETQLLLAGILNAQTKYEDALTVLLKIQETVNDVNHPIAMSVQYNIAMVHVGQGNYAEALKVFQKVSEKSNRVSLGIADVLFKQKNYHEALQDLQIVFNNQKAILGPNHPDTFDTQYSIASVLLAQGKWISAFETYRENLDSFWTTFGPRHPKVWEILRKLEIIYLSVSDIPEDLQKGIINIAASNGDIEMVRRLLKNADVGNEKDVGGWTPLHHAASNGHMDVVKMLIKYGADVTQVTNKGYTPLHAAASKGCRGIVEVLIQHVNHKMKDDFINAKTTGGGATSLHIAAKNGHLDIVKFLLKRGAIYNVENKQGKTPLNLSKNQKITKLLKLVKDLFEDAREGNVDMISKLEAIKADEFVAVTEACNEEGKKILLVLVKSNHNNVAQKLLELLNMQNKYVDDLNEEVMLKYFL